MKESPNYWTMGLIVISFLHWYSFLFHELLIERKIVAGWTSATDRHGAIMDHPLILSKNFGPALHLASYVGASRVMDILLDNGADINMLSAVIKQFI